MRGAGMAEGRIAQGLEAKLCCGCWLGVWVAGQSIVLGALFMRIAELKNTSPKLLSMITTQPARDNIAIGSRLECKMANLLVRGLDDSLVQTLREQAALRRLPDLVVQVRKLRERLESLEGRENLP